MALSVTANLSDITLAEVAGDWVGTNTQDLDNFVQGSASNGWAVAKNSIETATVTGTFDMSDVNTHVYWWMNSSIASFIEPKRTGTAAPSGVMLRLTSATGSITWHIAGSDTWNGAWICFAADTRNTTEIYAQTGTMTWSAVTEVAIIVDASNSGNLRNVPANVWLDAARYGTGLTITGDNIGLTDGFAEAAAVDANINNRWGILENIEGTIFSQGRITVNATTFNSSNEDFKFRGVFPSGGFVSTDLYQLTFGAGSTVDLSSGSLKAAGITDTARFVFDPSLATSFTMDGMSVSRAGFSTFAAGQTITASVFNDCFQVDPSTATLTSCTFSNYSGVTTQGALLLPLTNNVSDPTFTNNLRAVHIDTAGSYDFAGWSFSGNTFDVLNSSTGAVIINASGSTVSSSIEINGGTTDIQNLVTFKVTNIEEGTEVRIVEAVGKADVAGAEQVGATPSGLDGVSVSADPDNAGKFALTYQYQYTSDLDINIAVVNTAYQSLYLSSTLTSLDKSVNVFQIKDRQYLNP